MNIKRSTPIPNIFFDTLLPKLTLAELKLLLIIYRQTNGWIDQKTKKRKTRDWISQSLFSTKTGLSRQTISGALHELSQKRIIRITDYRHTLLDTPEKRRGKSRLYYAVNSLEDVGVFTTSCKVSGGGLVGLPVQDKTNSTKEKKTKGLKSIKDILKNLYRWK